MRVSGTTAGCLIVFAAAAMATLAGCETPPPPYVPKALAAPEVVNCNDHTGHNASAKPWVMGGTCTCTPSQELMAKLHADGVAVGMSAADLRAAYDKGGIKLGGDGHQWCNGLCPAGPHVVLGGKCMAPPTPGTEYYEQVIFAKRPVPIKQETLSTSQ